MKWNLWFCIHLLIYYMHTCLKIWMLVFSGNIYEIYINVPMHPYRLCDSEVGQSQNIDMSFIYIYIYIFIV